MLGERKDQEKQKFDLSHFDSGAKHKDLICASAANKRALFIDLCYQRAGQLQVGCSSLSSNDECWAYGFWGTLRPTTPVLLIEFLSPLRIRRSGSIRIRTRSSWSAKSGEGTR